MAKLPACQASPLTQEVCSKPSTGSRTRHEPPSEHKPNKYTIKATFFFFFYSRWERGEVVCGVTFLCAVGCRCFSAQTDFHTKNLCIGQYIHCTRPCPVGFPLVGFPIDIQYTSPQNSATSDSKYIGEKPSVMLWHFNYSTKTGTHRKIRLDRTNCWFNLGITACDQDDCCNMRREF